MAKRLTAMGNPRYTNGFEPTMHEEALQKIPFFWKKSRKVFVNSISDLFHENISDDFIFKVFDVMNQTRMHSYQILTKRPERVVELSKNLKWTANIWQGTSIENSKVLHRIDTLKEIPARIRFISFEPLIGPIESLNYQIFNGQL
jgi:protein gp37